MCCTNDNTAGQRGSQTAPAQTSVRLLGIEADLLIPGRGEPIKHGAVVLREEKIDWVGIQSEMPAKYKALDFTHVHVLMPGLWDCHGRFLKLHLSVKCYL